MKPGVPPYVIGIAAIAAVIIPVLGCQSKGGTAESKTDPAAYKAKMQQHGGGGQPSYGRPPAGTAGPGGGMGGGRPGGPPGPGAGR